VRADDQVHNHRDNETLVTLSTANDGVVGLGLIRNPPLLQMSPYVQDAYIIIIIIIIAGDSPF
jgi:hypothetical protein